MAGENRAEGRAVERWLRQGLIDAELAGRLRAESEERAELQRRRFAQAALALAGAVVLLLAAGTFLRTIWPSLSVGVRCVLIGVLGLALGGTGLMLEARERWRRVGYAFQVAGLGAIVIAVGYSEEAWPAGSAGGVAAGSVSLATAGAALVLALRRSTVMPAVVLAAGYAFVGAGLARIADLESDAIIWMVDGLFVVTVAVLAAVAVRGRERGLVPWLLPALAVQLYVALLLLTVTSLEPLDLGERTAFVLDGWLLAATALAWWGVRRAPSAVRRPWYAGQFTLSMLLAIWLGFWTMTGPLDAGPTASALVVALAGALGLAWAVPLGQRDLMLASCVAVVSAAWYYAVEGARVLGTVLALAVTAGLLFWLAGRMVRGGRTP